MLTVARNGAPCERIRCTTLRRARSRGCSQDGVRAATEMPLRAYRSNEGTSEECRRDRIQALVKTYE
jgi:hypothetical protein